MSALLLVTSSLFVLIHSYNDLCIQYSENDKLDQRYMFDVDSHQKSKFNLVWKGMAHDEYWFWLAYYNHSYEWTIDDQSNNVLRYCTLEQEQQDSIKKGDVMFLNPFECENWFLHNYTTKKSHSLPFMELYDCDIMSIDSLLEYIVSSSGYSASINNEGQIVIDTNADTDSNQELNNKKDTKDKTDIDKADNKTEKSNNTGHWNLRYTDIIIFILILTLFCNVFRRGRKSKKLSPYRQVTTDSDAERFV